MSWLVTGLLGDILPGVVAITQWLSKREAFDVHFGFALGCGRPSDFLVSWAMVGRKIFKKMRWETQRTNKHSRNLGAMGVLVH